MIEEDRKYFQEQENRLKTLEEKIEFIMENSHWTKWFTTEPTLIRRPLRDLWIDKLGKK